MIKKNLWFLQEIGPALNQYLLHAIKLIAMMVKIYLTTRNESDIPYKTKSQLCI